MAGEPEQRIQPASQPRRVALMADDYIGMKPTMHVSVGDEVQRGQLPFEDKKTPGVRHTSPASGTVVAINRGERRVLQSVVIQLDAGELAGAALRSRFAPIPASIPGPFRVKRSRICCSSRACGLRCEAAVRQSSESGRRAAFGLRHGGRHESACADSRCGSGRQGSRFRARLSALAKLTEGPVYVCASPGSSVTAPEGAQFRLEHFGGPHPAGTVGVHIHRLDPVDRNKTVWHLDYQDAIAIGKLFSTGELDVERVISLAGPAVRRPRLLRTRLGAATDDLAERELANGENRLISGSFLSGRTASGEVFGYLGRFHRQISVVPEDRRREFLGWLAPGSDKFSTINTFVSRLIPGRTFRFTTTTNGSDRAMVPIGMYERVMPLDILPDVSASLPARRRRRKSRRAGLSRAGRRRFGAL